MNATTKTIFASLAVIGLCLCAVGGVTYSWFSDTEQTDITVTTGVVSIDVTADGSPIHGTYEVETLLNPGTSINKAITISSKSTIQTKVVTTISVKIFKNEVEQSYVSCWDKLSVKFAGNEAIIDGQKHAIDEWDPAIYNSTPVTRDGGLQIELKSTAGNEYQGLTIKVSMDVNAYQQGAPVQEKDVVMNS